ncbi:unnamed protein product [Prunus brigantina]
MGRAGLFLNGPGRPPSAHEPAGQMMKPTGRSPPESPHMLPLPLGDYSSHMFVVVVIVFRAALATSEPT